MKRIFLFTLLLCAFTVALFAQKKEFFKEKKHELRLSYGSVNDDDYYDRFRYYYQDYAYYNSYLGNINSPNLSTYAGSTKTTGVINGSYFYNMSDVRFSFGATLSYSGYNTEFKNRIDGKKAGDLNGHNIALTPRIKYAWLSKENFRFYSGIGWSFYWDISRYNLNVNDGATKFKATDTNFDTQWMITPIGFSFGKDIFVFGEANIGGRVGNLVGGIGYRF
jgi:hypothetical protein